MGGWFRKEIKTVDDLKGLKFRIGGLGGTVLSKLGVVPQQIAPPTSIRRSSAARSTRPSGSAPTTTRSSASHKVAKYYYTPGWWEGSAQITSLVNRALGGAAEQFKVACSRRRANEQTLLMMAKYDAKNPEALKRLIAAGVQLRRSREPVMEACYKATVETFDELSAKSPDFKKDLRSWKSVPRTSRTPGSASPRTSLDNFRFDAPTGDAERRASGGACADGRRSEEEQAT